MVYGIGMNVEARDPRAVGLDELRPSIQILQVIEASRAQIVHDHHIFSGTKKILHQI